MLASVPRLGAKPWHRGRMNPPLIATPSSGPARRGHHVGAIRPDLTLESALAALDDVVRSEDVERDTYRRPPQQFVRVARPAR